MGVYMNCDDSSHLFLVVRIVWGSFHALANSIDAVCRDWIFL